MSADSRSSLMSAFEDCVSAISNYTRDPTYHLVRIDSKLGHIEVTGLGLTVKTTMVTLPKPAPGVDTVLYMDALFTLRFYDNGPCAAYYALKYDTYRAQKWYTRDKLSNLSKQVNSDIDAIFEFGTDITKIKECND